ncbi:hypothetical protein COLO4_32999 [Corchorus olitorius]|uniref:F-box domain-containing protein n=1 Tax=Corchorus olitorius TaxID=93759 RepID=A0A1R3GX07_9ROSI|nr:hypothetical protein COLO4_32999 [Corchorus olitorius]
MEKSSPTLAEQVVNNEDLLTEILLKVPSKSLLRLKLVSKQWRDLISSTSFRRSHTRTHHGSLKTVEVSYFQYQFLDKPSNVAASLPLNPHDDSRLPPFDFLDDDDFPDVNILESCGGLLLCVSHKFHVSGRTYFICNPTTREYKILPPPPPEDTDRIRLSPSLAFDPLKSPHYKIIYVSSSGDLIHIYSSETNSWSSLKIELSKKFRVTMYDLDQGVFLNGAIHWYSRDEESQYFDVDKECLKTMPMPQVNEFVDYFGECGGHLNLVFAHEEARFSFSIFEMEMDYSNCFFTR